MSADIHTGLEGNVAKYNKQGIEHNCWWDLHFFFCFQLSKLSAMTILGYLFAFWVNEEFKSANEEAFESKWN